MRGRMPKSFTYTGDGSNAVTLDVGFQAKKVEILNYTDADVEAYWMEGMPDASAVLRIDSGSGTTDLSKVTTAGITVGPKTVTIGTNASLIENAKVYYVLVY